MQHNIIGRFHPRGLGINPIGDPATTETPGGPPADPTTGTTSQTSQSTDNGGQQHTKTKQSTTSTTSSTSSTTSTSTTQSKDNDDQTKTTSSESSSSSTTGTSSSSSTTEVSSVSTTSHTTAIFRGTTGTTGFQGIVTGDATDTSSAPDSTISSADSNAAASSSLNVGAVIGGIAGAGIGIAIIFFLVMHFLKRRRSNDDGEEEFDPASFRKSGVMVGDHDPFNPRPPTMIERKLAGHNIAPSISENMAGAGLGMYAQGQYAQQFQPGQVAHEPLQERQQYTYGQQYDEDGHDGEYNGAYSSEPHPQDIYAAEAYAYPGELDPVVTPGGHGQEMSRHQESAHQDPYGGM